MHCDTNVAQQSPKMPSESVASVPAHVAKPSFNHRYCHHSGDTRLPNHLFFFGSVFSVLV
jgi:hypothetical protein